MILGSLAVERAPFCSQIVRASVHLEICVALCRRGVPRHEVLAGANLENALTSYLNAPRLHLWTPALEQTILLLFWNLRL